MFTYSLKIRLHHSWTWDNVRQFLWKNLLTYVNPNRYAGYGCWFVAELYFVYNKIYLHSMKNISCLRKYIYIYQNLVVFNGKYLYPMKNKLILYFYLCVHQKNTWEKKFK